jgi:prephenate dehydrogenase
MNVTIVGLDVLGTSLGLALKAAAVEAVVMGHDSDTDRVGRARKLGAIDRSHWNLIAACEQADLIVLNEPLDQLQKSIASLRTELKEQAVLVDLSPVKRPGLAWAREFLPWPAQFVGAHIISPRLLLGEAQPSAGLLQGTTFYIVAAKESAPQVVNLISNLALAVGAVPQYIDASEHDGLMAATAQLPLVSALALAEAIAGSAGLIDRTRACGAEMAGLAAVLGNAPAGMAESILANKDNLLRWLQLYGTQLAHIQRLVEAEEHQALSDLFARAGQNLRRCLSQGDIGFTPETLEAETVALKETKNWWRGMLLGRLGRRKRR